MNEPLVERRILTLGSTLDPKTRSMIVANCKLISHNQSLRFGVSVDDEHGHDGLDHSSLVGQPDGTLGLGANL